MIDIPSSTTDAVETANSLIEQIEGYLPKLLNFAINIIIALIIFFIGRYIIKLIIKLIDKFLERAKVEISVQRFLNSLIRVILYIILIILICHQVGIETTSFIAVIGSIGLAIGLALQGSLSNFAGGVLILVLKPFKVGDYIRNTTSGQEGTVNKIDLFYTSLISPDNLLIFVPNGTLANSSIINTTAFEKRRVDVPIAINSTSDIAKTKEILLNLVNQYEKVLKDEETDIFIKDIIINQITIEFRVWVKTQDFWEAKCYLVEQAKLALEVNDVKMPYNIMEVHIQNN